MITYGMCTVDMTVNNRRRAVRLVRGPGLNSSDVGNNTV